LLPYNRLIAYIVFVIHRLYNVFYKNEKQQMAKLDEQFYHFLIEEDERDAWKAIPQECMKILFVLRIRICMTVSFLL